MIVCVTVVHLYPTLLAISLPLRSAAIVSSRFPLSSATVFHPSSAQKRSHV